MKSNRKATLAALPLLILLIKGALSLPLLAGTIHLSPQDWSLQVDEVQAGDVNIEPAFKIAIYENLLQELAKTKQFKEVFRSGEHTAAGAPDVLVLKTTVERYTPGSETMRAVTTVFGATKLKVRTQLSTREGQVVLDRELNGNVRFMGDNLRATHNLAHNIAHAIKKSPLPDLQPLPKQ
ncbi:MAG TPA: hypothetical protein VMF91_25935 [Bryobacteraceae bacterium]|nr:hypothetical protein [Bryobacteraceae bacterium]